MQIMRLAMAGASGQGGPPNLVGGSHVPPLSSDACDFRQHRSNFWHASCRSVVWCRRGSGTPRSTSGIQATGVKMSVEEGVRFGAQGRYRVLATLGDGAMGRVYHAVDERLQRHVAIKVLHPELAGNQKIRDRFRTEAVIQANLEHPNIVRALDSVESDSELAIIMEFVQGSDMQRLLDQEGGRPLPLVRVHALLDPVLDAMSYAHSRNVVHRDLKPANILIDTRDGGQTPRIADFGVSKILGNAPMRTRAGAVLGTPMYMPPEQLRGEPVDATADVYAAGAVIYQLVTGRAPFANLSEYELTHQVLSGHRPPSPSSLVPGLPRDVDWMVDRAMAPDRGARTPSMAQLRSEFRAVMERFPSGSAAVHSQGWPDQPPMHAGGAAPSSGGVAPAPAPSPPVPPAARAGFSLWIFVGVAVVLVSLVVALALALRGPSSTKGGDVGASQFAAPAAERPAPPPTEPVRVTKAEVPMRPPVGADPPAAAPAVVAPAVVAPPVAAPAPVPAVAAPVAPPVAHAAPPPAPVTLPSKPPGPSAAMLRDEAFNTGRRWIRVLAAADYGALGAMLSWDFRNENYNEAGVMNENYGREEWLARKRKRNYTSIDWRALGDLDVTLGGADHSGRPLATVRYRQYVCLQRPGALYSSTGSERLDLRWTSERWEVVREVFHRSGYSTKRCL